MRTSVGVACQQSQKQNGNQLFILGMHHSATTKIKSDVLAKSELIKQNLTLRSRRQFAGTTLTQNFFASLQQDEPYQPFTQSYTMSMARASKIEEGHAEGRQTQQRRSVRRSRKKLEQTVLQPMRQKEKTEIFSSSSVVLGEGTKPPHFDDIEEILLSPSQVQRQKEVEQEKESLAMQEMVARRGRRRSLSRHKDGKEEPCSNQKPLPKNLEEQTFEGLHFAIDLPKITGALLFDEDEQAKQAEQKQQQPIQEESFAIPKREFTHEFNDEEQEHSSPQKNADSEEDGMQNINMGGEYFDFQDQSSVRKNLFVHLPKNINLTTRLIRDKEGLNSIWPEFHLELTGDKQRLISGKKTSTRYGSTFTLSRNKFIFDETSQHYVGKVKSSSEGDAYNIFGPGLNPSDAKQRGVEPRQLLATLVYSNTLFHTGGPRKFSAYVLQPGYNYYKDIPQVMKYREEIPLSVLYTKNKDKIRHLTNRKPFLAQSGGYVLNFGGLAVCPSIKNFILQDPQTGQGVVLFAKQTDNTFSLNIYGGISPYVAFAFAVASCDSRMAFQ